VYNMDDLMTKEVEKKEEQTSTDVTKARDIEE
jgi:hypothetical protein